VIGADQKVLLGGIERARRFVEERGDALAQVRELVSEPLSYGLLVKPLFGRQEAFHMCFRVFPVEKKGRSREELSHDARLAGVVRPDE